MVGDGFARLDGCVAVVTGAAGGIGSSIVRTILEAGACVVMNDRRAPALQELHESLGLTRRDVIAVPGDVSDSVEAEALVQRAVDTFGKVCILVNVVGGLSGPIRRDFMEIDAHQLEFAFRVNVRTTFHCMQAALRVMIPARSGAIVNIASTAWAGSVDHADYAAAKAAVVSLTRSVAGQVAVHGITVNAVAPGLTLTDAVRESALAATADSPPLGRPNEPEDVANAVRFLCSSAARNISGHLMTVAGGANPSL